MRWVITGANRGIGLEFVKQLAARGDRVDAAVRDPSGAQELGAVAARESGRVAVHACDVANEASVRAFAGALGDAAIDVLVNNAGVMGQLASLESLDLADMLRTFDVNALGAVRVTRALLPAMRRGSARKIAHVTSGMGSIGDNTSGGAYGYRMSKAALNMANKSMSIELRGEGFACVVINPGWVKTDMGGAGAPTAVEDSVAKMIALVDKLEPSHSGAFLDYRGGTFPY